MPRFVLPGFLALMLVVSGLVLFNGGLIALALPIIGYLIWGMWEAPSSPQIKVRRALSEHRIGPDTTVQVRVDIENHGPAIEELIVEDQVPPDLEIPTGAPRHIAHLRTGEQFTFSYSVLGKRGNYELTGFKAISRGITGLIQETHYLEALDRLLILPPVMRLKGIGIRPRKTRVYAGNIPARVGGSGVEFFGVRNYQEADSPRWINWRLSNRQPGAWFTNEFMQERVADVGIILDGRMDANLAVGDESIFEYSVTATAALVDAFLAQGDRVSLLLYGEFLQWTFPGYGKVQRERIMRDLASAHPGQSAVFSYLKYLPTQIYPSQSQLVLVSPLKADDPDVLLSLRARGYQVLVISPDPIDFECNLVAATPTTKLAARILEIERELLIQKILRMGIHVVNWKTSDPFDRVMYQQLRQIEIGQHPWLGNL